MKIIDIKTTSPYKIYINKKDYSEIGRGRKIHLITDANVEKYHSVPCDYKYTLSPGEGSKSFNTYKSLCEEMIKNNIHRNDLIITFGGGVIGDLGGFVAATLLRGIDFIQIPTTLLAMVDSSVGGKVAINTEFGKNLIGSFYQPKAVYINTDYLTTLPKREYYSGMSEVIKYNLIYDKNLFSQNNIEDIIYKSCSIKGEIVSQDEKEQNIRKILNFGHTLGHIIETYTNYKYTHGESVAIGMYSMCKISEKLGAKDLSSYTKDILTEYHLPYKFPFIPTEKILELVSKDKKSSGSQIDCILLSDIGKAYIKKFSPKELVDLL